MIETTITLRKLTATEGHVLTNGDVYGKEIYLGIHDHAGNWHEITDAEYAEIVAAEEARQAIRNEINALESQM